VKNLLVGGEKVGIDSGMRELAQEIISSHEERTKMLGGVKEETKNIIEGTRNLLGNFTTLRKQESVQLRKELSQGVVDRRKEVKEMRQGTKEMRQGIKRDLKEAASAWQELVRTPQVKRAKAEVQHPPKVEKEEKKNFTSQ